MIVAAAVKYDGAVYTGVRHCEIFKDLLRLGHKDNTPLCESNGYIQGFIDNHNNFMGRDESLDHAYECGQIGVDENDNFDIIGGTLTSEDLW